MKIQFLPLLMTASMVLSTASIDLPNAAIVNTSIGSGAKASDEIVKTTLSEVNSMPAFDWAETSFDFGKVIYKAPVTHEFRFVNKGSEPLLITSVQASCGCTVAKYTKDPIAPGAEGFVTATYDAATKGIFNKTITVNANTQDGIVLLGIRGEVQ
jgi:hypothetical protein